MQQVYGGRCRVQVLQVTFLDCDNSQGISGLGKKELFADFSRGAKIKGIYYAKTVLTENLSCFWKREHV
jgi:hypothetical protein